ncbi:MAG: recombination protein RecR [Alphaproteobacteria bacterium]|jgi:recombination protein RecR|nr:recombination protein RecR [Alphaproteobacteria bacterium]MCB1550903.1 recombination protein RecR [Alphaproteobacteria bacterium]MCB9985788.1 recombination protein RecR [Micavibrio sp.]
MKQDGPLAHLIRQLSILPGLGPRSARRAALTLISKKDDMMFPLVRALTEAAEHIKTCPVCGALDDTLPCRICSDGSRDRSVMCVVATLTDLWAIERAGGFRGIYHVLGGVLSALDGIGPDHLSLGRLEERMQDHPPREIILALPATVDGQSTAHVVMDMLGAYDLKISRLAHGMPIGGELDYLDDGTILTAFQARG